MKLWLLKPVSKEIEGKYWGWDCTYKVVVRAKTEDDARRLAGTVAGDEYGHYDEDGNYEYDRPKKIWLDSSLTSCERISASGGEEIICRDFAAG